MRKLITLAAGLVLGALALGSCSKPAMTGGARTEVTFGVLSVEGSQTMQQNWAPIFADMEKQTGLKINPLYPTSYNALIEGMRFNQVQAAWFSNAPGYEASKRAQGEVFAHTTYPDGAEGYQSIIIVRADSKLNNENDLLKCDKSLNFGMGDPLSTSGTKAPLAYLFYPRHIDPNTCFKQVKSASHSANVEGVIAGVLDAATNNSTALVELNQTPAGRATTAKIKVIWSSPMLPTDVIEYRSDLDPATKEKLRSFFLSYGQGTGPEAERERRNLMPLVWGPLKPDDNSHFLAERELEAKVDLGQADIAHDAAAMAKAQAELDAVHQEQAALAARTAPQALADAPSSATSR